ncbi:MAG TPA: TIGR01777 family oxidoreductase [Solirubrobacterales bacterium]|nr:TIGR01777 family oxidoreductase [Solirubrobacterales bacterium]
MRVLVTGASGLIGSALCDALLDRGDTVVGLTRDPERARRTNPAIVWHAWEPTLERPAAEPFEGVDGVVNLLGERIDQRWTDDAKRRIMGSRRTGTHNLVQGIAALEQRPRALVSQSGIGFYGDRGDEVLDESSSPGEGFDAEVTREWERTAHEVEDCGVRLAILRSGQVLTPKGGLLGRLLPPFKLGLGGPIAGGRQYVSWIHIDDEVGLILWALDDERVSGALNATSPNPVTNDALAKSLGRTLSRPAVLPVPGIALDLMLGREFAAVVRGGQRAVPRRARELGFEFRHPHIDEALRDLL